MLCQSRLHNASEIFVRHKKKIGSDFLRFRIRSKPFARKGRQIGNNIRTQCARTLKMAFHVYYHIRTQKKIHKFAHMCV